jgi:glycosyltransferase involved in cell wall biosynthesis
MIILTCHASLVDGKIYEAPAGNFIEILKNKKCDFLFIRHSMDGKLSSVVYFYEKGLLIREKKLLVFSKISVLRYITEIIATTLFFLNLKSKENNIFIGIDPLGVFPGIILKKIGKVKRVIFYTPDYSPQRFASYCLNAVYHYIDRFCVKNSCYIWNVSTRIRDIRKQMGVSNDRNIFVPNIPSDEYKKFINNKKTKHTLITLGKVSDQMDFIGIFEAIKKMQSKFPNIIFKIIGNGQKEEYYKKYVRENRLESNVIFLGHLNHLEALSEISRSGIGLALYNGNWGFNYFGDSMKCREYFSFGLPVITTNTHSTVEEIMQSDAGIVCQMSVNEYIEAIKKILDNYEKYSENSQSLSEKYNNLHQELFEKYLLC